MIVRLGEQDHEALRRLLIRAELYATDALRKGRQCPPTLFMQTGDGPAMFTPDRLTNERSKDNFVTMAKLMCVANRATATAFVAEAWTRSAKDGEALDTSKRPSECPDRQEILLLMGETRYGNNQKWLPIIRSNGGQFSGFGAEHVMQTDDVKGRFAQFLPEKWPSLEDQRLAQEALRIVAREIGREQGHDREQERG